MPPLHLPQPPPEPACSCLYVFYDPRARSGVHTVVQVLPSCEKHGDTLSLETAIWLAEEEDAARAASVAMFGTEDRARSILRDRLELLREARNPTTYPGKHAARRGFA